MPARCFQVPSPTVHPLPHFLLAYCEVCLLASFLLQQILGSPRHWTHLPIAIEIAYQHPTTTSSLSTAVASKDWNKPRTKLKTDGDHWSLRCQCQDEVPAASVSRKLPRRRRRLPLTASSRFIDHDHDLIACFISSIL